MRQLALAAGVQWDALRASPRQWLAGWWWHCQGKRLRARSRLEPLVGRSRWAYALWIMRREQRLPALINHTGAPVCAVIDLTQFHSGLADTLEDACHAGFALVVVMGGALDTHAYDGAVPVNNLAELVRELRVRRIDWVCPVRAGDRLAVGAGKAYANVASSCDADVIYADDDLLAEDGMRCDPHFKPQWNAELIRHHDFISGACAFRWQSQLDGAGSLDDALRQLLAVAQTPPVHLPRVLHHRRQRPQAHLAPSAPTIRGRPRVSVIIPTRDHAEDLRTCLAGSARVQWDELEVIVVDNGSTDPAALGLMRAHAASGGSVIELPGPFNYSRLNNVAAKVATGDLLCLLNNDVEMLQDDWLAWLVAAAQLPDVGAVGARLLYPDRAIQHAGVVLGVGGGAAHAHRDVRDGKPGYFWRHLLPQFVSAVTGACLVVDRAKYMAVGGLDETNFPVAFNDVDLCLKLNARGWQSFYEPRAVLIHHESRSRGDDRELRNRDRFAAELMSLKRIWHTDGISDPFHHPQLSKYSDQFVLAL